jgi:hypothetical protein
MYESIWLWHPATAGWLLALQVIVAPDDVAHV